MRFLATPLFSKRDAQGRLVSKADGPWIATACRGLARAKALRGPPLDVFGYTAERRGESATIGEFAAMMRGVAQQRKAERWDTALALARLPQGVRGFGHVEAQAADAAQIRRQQLFADLALDTTTATATAAAGPATAAAA